MLARIVRWENGDPEALKESAAQIRADGEARGGPPEGIPSKGLFIFQDLDGGKAMAISLFETEEDYAEGDATLNSMSPPGEGMGQRVAVEKYEVAVRFEADA